MIKGQLHITIHTDGKLKHIVSINTSTLCNEFCNAMGKRELARRDREKKSVCELCYAEKNEKLRKQLEGCLKNNTDILTKKLLSEEEIPFLNNSYVRFHSFGEFVNDIHVQNFLNIAKHNPQTTFCLMTKRYDLIMKYPKLKNIIYIASSPIINVKIQNQEVLDYFDKIFTVYSDQNSACGKINCAGLSCITCKKCYTRRGSKYINELLRK